MDNTVTLSLVIPAFNEGGRIGKSLEKIFSYLNSRDYNFEVIIVNDGSKDNTLEVIKRYNHSNLIIINNRHNIGKGYSIKSGIEKAMGEFIFFSDADLSTPIEETDKLLSILKDGCDVAIASRHVPGADIKIQQPFYRQLMGRIFNLFVRLAALPGIYDSQCGFKGFRKDCGKHIFQHISVPRYSFDVELLYLARKFNYRIQEVPVSWYDSPSSRINPFTDPLRMLIDVLRVVWLHKNVKKY